jgi:hypothetical protein
MDAETKSAGSIAYAENWVFAPSIQKNGRFLKKNGGPILLEHGEESLSAHTRSIWYVVPFRGWFGLGKGFILVGSPVF